MPTTKSDLRNTAESISGFLGTIGKTIKENERQRNLAKVMKEFQDPNKLFMNEDGTPKSDAEIAPKITQGVMQFYQLGEDKLANGLISYYTNMSKSFDKDANNMFNYAGSKDDPRFPKDEAGNPQAPNSRVDYQKWSGTNQYAPQQPKSRYSFQRVELPGVDGSGVVKYYRVDKVDGSVQIVDESEFTKEIKESRYSGSNYNFSAGNEFKDQYTDTNGKQRTVVFKDGVPYDAGTQTKITDMTDWKPVGDLSQNAKQENIIANISQSVLGGMDFSGMKQEDMNKYGQMYQNELKNWVNGGVLPSFVNSEWIQKNSGLWYQMKELKGK